MSDQERIRIVLLGDSAVGKSSIIKRFLFNTYSDKYRTTIEDLFSKEFDLGVTTIKVDIFDTCGDFQFPAMRRLSIATAHAFLLVYSTLSLESFNTLKRCFEEIRQQRSDFQNIPIVVAGNKVDLATEKRQVHVEDVSEWLYCDLPKLRAKLIECSAKDNINIKEIFKQFVILSRILLNTNDESSLKRRSSAYVSATSKNSKTSASSTTLSVNDESSHEACSSGSETSLRPKPRSRSLIRRCSRKTKQQVRDTGEVDDCNVS
ncbi:hypothetical protein PGB90_006294 [Kerria lacca]